MISHATNLSAAEGPVKAVRPPKEMELALKSIQEYRR